MNLSGIVVMVPPAHFDSCVADIGALAGIEIHYTDAPTGRVVVVQEAPTVEDEMQGLLRIKARPHVIAAEMVYHYFADGDNDGAPPAR